VWTDGSCSDRQFSGWYTGTSGEAIQADAFCKMKLCCANAEATSWAIIQAHNYAGPGGYLTGGGFSCRDTPRREDDDTVYLQGTEAPEDVNHGNWFGYSDVTTNAELRLRDDPGKMIGHVECECPPSPPPPPPRPPPPPSPPPAPRGLWARIDAPNGINCNQWWSTHNINQDANTGTGEFEDLGPVHAYYDNAQQSSLEICQEQCDATSACNFIIHVSSFTCHLRRFTPSEGFVYNTAVADWAPTGRDLNNIEARGMCYSVVNHEGWYRLPA
jgi:roadblock/LC7 domain-containing protein